MEFIINRTPRTADANICILELGHSKPCIGKRADIVTRCYQFHYVTSGFGLFRGEKIESGCGFLVCPGEMQGMSVESDDFEQFWINFAGKDVSNLLYSCKIQSHSCVYSFRDNPLKMNLLSHLFGGVFGNDSLFEEANPYHNHNYLVGLLYQILSMNDNGASESDKTARATYADAVCSYIMSHYAESLTADWLAATVGLSPKYLSRVFMQEKGVSMIEYLTDVRLENACAILLNSDNSITDIAEQVGYKDALYFSKVFKRHKGLSPTEFREKNRKDHGYIIR
ncbi:MAG: helix-turn-helix transcriptional regulator [Clostridia bacterium]|nr:helix-turn-helix transcriptional regulator [Clostridia bacterium]